jgi:hypothetical protein
MKLRPLVLNKVFLQRILGRDHGFDELGFDVDAV